jgi:dimethylargininase
MRALVRRVPRSFAHALAAVRPDPPIDVNVARTEHAAYVEALRALGAEIVELEADEAHPDCVFVEDTAVVAGPTALVTRPGAISRRGETEAVAAALSRHLEVVRMQAPATLDGGDCLRLGDTFFVGRSARTNAEGVAMLEAVHGRVVVVDMPRGVLHLKCVCSRLSDERVLLAEGSLPRETFRGFDVVSIPAAETYAANVVALGSAVIVAAGHPRTSEALTRAGYEIIEVPTSQVRKADGSLTCQSIVF